MQQQFYSLEDISATGAIRSVIFLPTHTPTTICIATDASLELHTLTLTGLSLLKKINLHCTVTSLKAIPDYHRDTDFLFILDHNGNAAFWDVLLSTYSASIPANNNHS